MGAKILVTSVFLLSISFLGCSQFVSQESPSSPSLDNNSNSGSQSATLSWDANSESDLAGYEVHYGEESGNYSMSLDVGMITPVNNRVSYVLGNLASGKTYYFAVKAYDSSGNVSTTSNEVNKSF